MADGCRSLRDGGSAVGGVAARVLREYYPMRGSTGGKRAARPRAWWVLCALRGPPPCGAHTDGHSGVVWVLGRPRSIMRRHTRSAPANPDRTADAEPPTHSPQPIAPTTDGSGAGVVIGDRTGRILCGRRRRRRRFDPSRLSQGRLFKWAGRDAAAGARPADRPGGSVSPVLLHAADAAVLRRPCAAPHCVCAWKDVLQSSSREQVHRHDRELGRQHLQALLSVRPPAVVSQLAAPCDPAY